MPSSKRGFPLLFAIHKRHASYENLALILTFPFLQHVVQLNQLFICLTLFYVLVIANHLTDKDARAFADALKENRTLTYLDLSHNEFGEMGGIYLGAGLVRASYHYC